MILSSLVGVGPPHPIPEPPSAKLPKPPSFFLSRSFDSSTSAYFLPSGFCILRSLSSEFPSNKFLTLILFNSDSDNWILEKEKKKKALTSQVWIGKPPEVLFFSAISFVSVPESCRLIWLF